ncbi:MAG TPA: long-chain fatty acid--CoA ligase [Chloroflexia bacterium]|nr:long-chain fatty acid--CoA ligase [Chloroflexia bacterium]
MTTEQQNAFFTAHTPSDMPWLDMYEPEVPRDFASPDLTLHGLFEKTAAEYPDNIATIFFGARLTYAQLDDQANRFASALQALGVRPGGRVAIILPNCPQFLIALFGALKAGAIAIPLNPAYVPRELAVQFADAGIETVVTLNTLSSRVQEAMPGTPVRRVIVTLMQNYLTPLLGLMLTAQERRSGTGPLISYEGVHIFAELIRAAPPEFERPTVNPDDPALLLYTGGTTGTPKGATLSHRNITSNALQMYSWVWDTRPEKRDVYLGVIPFFHSYGMTVVMNMAVAAAASIVLLPRFTMKDVLRAIARFRPTVFPAVPTMYNAIARHPLAARYDLRSIRVCISGAAPLPAEVMQAFEGVTGARLVEGYGLTEASPVTHCNPIYGERRPGSIGLPLPGTRVRVVHPDTGEPLPPGEVGELAVAGPQVMQGYWNRPEETAEIIRDGWLLTGDMVRMDEQGYFYMVDRKKELIIVGGLNVYPREVEDALYENDKVQEVLVAGVPDAHRGEIVKAYVVLKPNAETTEDELKAFLAERLAPYKLPARITFRESLPKSAVGKYLRRELVAEELAKTEGSPPPAG